MQKNPTVAVIIPAHNEARYIASTVASIKTQNYAVEQTHIFVVDNNSSDNTCELAKNAGAEVILCPSGKVGAVRNLGVAKSTSDIVAFIDGDCEAAETWINSAVHKLLDPSIGAVGGTCLLPKETTWVERAFVGPTRLYEGETSHLAGSSFIMRRKDFETLNGFSELLNAAEDDELSSRIRGLGLKVITIKDCAVIHNGYPKNLSGIFKKQLWHARNQLEAAESWRDPTLVMTHAFLFSVLAIMTTLLSFHLLISLVFFIFAVGLAGLLSCVKILKNGGGLIRLIPLTVINIVYLSARSLALVGNYWRKILGTM